MPRNQGRLTRLWQELKRRKVFSVVTTYAATAYIIIEVTNNLADSLNLPGWIGPIVVLLLIIGLPVAVILSWIFDFTPQGIRKTESLEELAEKEIIPKPVKRRLKISDIVIAVLLVAVVILAWPKIFKPDTVKRLKSSGERISVAVMPFQNMTNDTTWKIWQEGIQQCLISAFSNTGELKVRPQEAINKLLQPGGLTEYAAISPGLAGTISKKLDADIFVNGSIKMAGPGISVDAQLIDTKSNEVLKSFSAEGPDREESIRKTIDTLSKKLNNFLIITKLIKENPVDGLFGYPTTTKSPEAFRFNMYGNKAFTKMDFSTARYWYSKALEVDSNYFDPLCNLAYSYGNVGMRDEFIQLVLKIYRKKDDWPLYEQLYANIMYSAEFEPLDVTIRNVRQRQNIDGLPDFYLGLCYNATNQYDKAINEFEKVQEQAHKWGKEFLKEDWAYIQLGSLYHKTGQYKKEKKLYREAEKFNDDHESTLNSK